MSALSAELSRRELPASGWMARLLAAATPAEVADAVLACALAHPACLAARVVAPADPPGPAPQASDPAGDTHEPSRARGAAATLEGTHVTWRLPGLPNHVLHATLAAAVQGDSFVEDLSPCVDAAALQLRRSLELADLRRSHRQLERSEALQRALFAISDLAGSDLETAEMLRGIHAILGTLMYAENFFIVRYSGERGTLQFIYFADVEDTEAPDTREIALESQRDTLTWHLLVGGRTLMGNAEQLRAQVEGALVHAGPDAEDWLGVPMLRDGVVRGALVVQSYRPGIGFSAEDRALLEFVGSHILTALERKLGKVELEERVRSRTLELAESNRGLQQEVAERKRSERLQAALFHIAQLATADIDEGEFHARVHAAVGELLNADNFFIGLLSDDRRVLDFPYYIDAGVRRTVSRELGRGLSEYVMREGRPLLGGMAEIDALARSGEIDPARIGRPAVCWLGVPLRAGDEVIGLIVVQSYTEEVVYRPADQELLGFVALQVASSIRRRRAAATLQRAYAELEQRVEERTRELREQVRQRERAQEQLEYQLRHDALTGLPNRGFLRARLEQVLAALGEDPRRRCALLYLDIDRFKIINDSLGHLAGDSLLREVARRLQGCVREPDMVARLSGDEFAILLVDVRDADTAQGIARRVLDAVGEPMELAGRELQPSVSIGIALGDARYVAADELVRHADLALYRAKDLGRKRCELYDERLARSAIDELAMEGELRESLQKDGFVPWFQPICRLDTGEVVGHEALMRWMHPRRGVLAPAAFVQVAEDSGQIEAIDWRVFERACRVLASLRGRDAFLTINVSALHLRQADFDARLLRLLEHVGLASQRLVVEVTEGALLDDPEHVRALLERLRAGGVGAALDDFGTGYSSLSYLHSLPLRMLKIDRAFVSALGKGGGTTTTVVAAILALARALNMQVVAEGIETPAQRAALLRMGCELGQGYLLGRPAPAPVAGSVQASGGA
jgi:diguanylate cyclase (GGDEF)-like protein